MKNRVARGPSWVKELLLRAAALARSNRRRRRNRLLSRLAMEAATSGTRTDPERS
jgi:hypothetical protein